MKVTSPVFFARPAAPSRPAAVPIASAPETAPDIGDSVKLSDARPVAWDPRREAPKFFGNSWRSNLLMGICGPIAVALSKTGEAVEKLGQHFGWWDSLGTISKPLPPSQLTDQPASKLERPLLLVPGFHTPEDRFDHLLEKLTENGTNGGRPYYMANGQFYKDLECTTRVAPPGDDARVFVAVFPKTNTPPDQSAPDLARSLETIQKITKQTKVDVTGYSMGGLATRVYLDQGGDAVGKFMMLATPNQGSALARTSLGLLDLQSRGWDTDWLVSRKPLDQSDRAALGWLLPTKDGPKNPQLNDLNSRWPMQKTRVEDVRLVGGSARVTLGKFFVPTFGDGTVTAESLRLDGEKAVYLKQSGLRNHGMIFSNPGTYQEMRDFFGWQ